MMEIVKKKITPFYEIWLGGISTFPRNTYFLYSKIESDFKYYAWSNNPEFTYNNQLCYMLSIFVLEIIFDKRVPDIQNNLDYIKFLSNLKINKLVRFLRKLFSVKFIFVNSLSTSNAIVIINFWMFNSFLSNLYSKIDFKLFVKYKKNTLQEILVLLNLVYIGI